MRQTPKLESMTPADIQAILNCINQYNKAIDFKQWERLNLFTAQKLSIKFPKSSLLPTEQIEQSSFIHYLSKQLKELKSMHRDYNFSFRDKDQFICRTDFRIETKTESNQLISSASGVHIYHMKKDGVNWKIAGIERQIMRVDGAVPEQSNSRILPAFWSN